MKLCLFYGHYSSNIGDLAINRGLADLLHKSYDKDVELHVVFLNEDGARLGGHDSFRHDLPVKFHKLPSAPSILSKAVEGDFSPFEFLNLKSMDAVLINGGEHFFSSRGNPNTFNMFWRSVPIHAAAAASVPSILLPSTLGPFDAESKTKWLIDGIKSIGAPMIRDTISAEAGKDLWPENETQEFLDLAFHIDFKEHDRSTDAADKVIGLVTRLDASGLRVGTKNSANTTTLLSGGDGSDILAYRTSYDICGRLLEKGCTIKLFIQAESDRALAEKLHLNLTSKFDSTKISLSQPNDLDEYLRELSSCSCVITSRLHAAILSMVARTPVVGFYYEEHGHKMPGVFRMLGYEESCFKIAMGQSDGLPAFVSTAVEKAMADFPAVLDRLDAKKIADMQGFKSLLKQIKPKPLVRFRISDAEFGQLTDLIELSEAALLASFKRDFAQRELKKLAAMQDRLEEWYVKTKQLQFRLEQFERRSEPHSQVLLSEFELLQQRTTHLEEMVALRDNHISLMSNSVSWQITKPLRFLARTFRSLVHR
jgi:polysaccharide pyruvyl transferase WcaK-like protein